MANVQTNKSNAKSKSNGQTPLGPMADTLPTMMIACSLIDPDPKFNARQDDIAKDPETKALAKTIKKEGQLAAVGLKPNPKKAGRYLLRWGFRRFTAISGSKEDGFLGDEYIRASILPAESSELDDFYTNLTENVARKDLSAYDLARRCQTLSVDYGESGDKIGARIGKSTSYVNNLLRIISNCIPEILERWKEECSYSWDSKKGKICTTDWLNRAAQIKDPDEQDAYFHGPTGLNDRKPDPEDGKGKPQGGQGGNEPEPLKVAGKRSLIAALEAAKATRKEEGDDGDDSGMLDGLITGLRFALGEIKSIKGVYRPAAKSDKEAE